ncbi:AAT family amino acid transporter-3 [Coleophoma cylindrospora]|uniref:AAT family amino acid transporter-3 n=1 Tax=Coleophoma cylindrospora TaxID=1849047 RepID=A0A3D8QKA8_9HELO|nr:AAT family amino acid transporter-3 [Coleophoma cylindrospora]
MSFEEKKTAGTSTSVDSKDVQQDYDNPGEPIVGQTYSLQRNFKARHIQMICLGGCIGSGLFIATGKSLRYGGAPGMLIGYTVICTMALAVMSTMSEATVLWPTTGSFMDHAARFVDPAMGFAIGICEYIAWMTIVAAEGAVFNIIIGYWTDKVPVAAAMTIYLFVVFMIHTLPNSWFAEFEFVTAALKIIAVIILILVCIAIASGAGPTGSTDHAANYKSLPAFPYGFKGVCTVFPLAAWATGGQEIMGITAGEAHMPRWDMPRAFNSLFVRILFIYLLSVIFITVLVNYTDPLLLGTSSVAASPFVIAMKHAGISVLPDLLNVVIILGLCAIGAESLYISSRVQTAMAGMGMMPKVFGRVDKKGRPIWSLLCTMALSAMMTYINCSSTGGVVFTWFSSIASTVYFMAWMVISVTNWQMRKALKVQNDPALELPYAVQSPWYPLASVYLFIMSTLMLALTGYSSMMPVGTDGINVTNFFETFLGVPIFVVAYIGYKLVYRTKFVNPAEADLQTGRRPLTEDDIAMLDKYYAQSVGKRALSYFHF